jgi:UDP-N-acetylglucosamine 2-epimerase (non-hydrolysing)
MINILVVFGTRPEAIKMVPLVRQLKQNNINVKVCVTAQHREMLDQVLDFFEIVPDYDLDLMQPNQSLNELSSRIIHSIDVVLVKEVFDWVLVHGDTTTSTMVALAAFHRNIKVGHIEAGLRTYNKQAPFPEELNRQLTSRIADVHFAPTAQATQNLLNEGVSKCIIIETGNTVIDSLIWTIDKITAEGYFNTEIEQLKKTILLNKKIVLVTGHRRENFGEGFVNICDALLEISLRDDVTIVYPVHMNPNVKDVVYEKLANTENVYLIPPVSYPAFVWLMQQSFLIVSDSGGIQEEAPSIGKPVLVTRTVSERPEGVAAGFSKLIGTDKNKIIKNIQLILDDFNGFGKQQNPYGMGDSAKQIVEYLLNQN